MDSASQCEGEEGWCTKLYWEIYSRFSEALGPQFLPEIEFRTAFDLLISLTNATDLIKERSFDSWRLSDLVFAHAFQVKERSILAGRRVASLAGGRIALVPPITQAGDFIYQLDRESEREWDSTFVFRPLSKDVAQDSTRLLSVSQLNTLDDFRYRRQRFGGSVSEAYKHCILLGQGRVFEKGSSKQARDWSAEQTQLLVVY